MLLVVLDVIYCSTYLMRLDLTRNGSALIKECVYVSREIRKEYNRVINFVYLVYVYVIIVIHLMKTMKYTFVSRLYTLCK